jgi:class 3 adenylate cyclase/tetratricopeptide (TPR) repeat protein
MAEPPLRTVTAAFSDLVNSVGLAARLSEHAYFNEVLDPFYALAEEVITDHGGKMRPVFAGDKVLAVFGVPVEQVDDAVRAVEAAVALRSRVAELSARLERDRDVGLEVHTGVNTGSALVREPDTDPTAVFGDAVNVGARLQDAAGGGEILLGPVTYELVRGVAVAEPVPLVVRGRDTPMTAWRLLDTARGEEPLAPRAGTPLVGRTLELAQLRLSYERMLQEGRCHLVNVLGATGVGKSRLIDEFLRTLDGVPLVLRGRCQPYGPGITYRPIMQLVRHAAGITPGDSDDEMHSRLMQLVGDERIAARVMRLVGVPGSIGDPDETFRAVQRTFELLAERQPLVVVIEDLHAAQPASLEGIERLVESLRNCRVLAVCMARSEFVEGRRDWGGSIPNATSVQLSPLNEQQAMQLLGYLLDGSEPPAELQRQASLWAGGNPFYLEELVAMLIDAQTLRRVDARWEVQGDLGDLRVTPRIQAVLGARLSRLGEEERMVIQRAAVVGLQFDAADVAALLQEVHGHSEVTNVLDGLVDKELLVHDPAAPVRGAAGRPYSFRHLLIQDTAYRRVDKGTRSGLHRLYAKWLEQTKPDTPAVRDQIGFHLDKAYRDRVEELGREDADAQALATSAGGFLAAAGSGYVLQGDFPTSAVSSLRRAIDLLPEDEPRRLQAKLDLAEALRDQGAAGESREAFAAVEAAARQATDKHIEMHALLGRLELEWFGELTGGWEQGRQDIDRTILEFFRSGDNLGLAKAYRLLAHGSASVGESTKAREAAEQAIEFVRREGNERLEAKILRLYCVILFWGPTPLDEVVRKSEEALEWARARGLYSLETGALGILARAAAMRGDFDEARRLATEARRVIPDLGELLAVAYDSISEGLIELLAGEPDAAIGALNRGFEALERRGGMSPLAVLAANLARAFIVKGQDDDAERLIRRCREAAAEGQLDTQIKWRALQGIVLARRGEIDEATRLAREAVALAERSEQLDSQAEALADLADVLQRAGAVHEAVQHAERALTLYERKGNVVAAARVRQYLDRTPAP